jgi:multidrug resistance protein, MATE family
VWGFPEMQLQGSALASIIQYSVMLLGALVYSIGSKENRKYGIDAIQSLRWSTALSVMTLSWPVMLDKASMAIAKIWLAKQLAPFGEEVLASFTVIKDLEQFAFIPAVAGAQVITLLVSNDYGAHKWEGIKNTIKRVLIISGGMVGTLLIIFSLQPAALIRLFDKTGTFTAFAAQAFPFLSILVLFDVLQLVLSGALRGAGDVKTVMNVRLIVVFGYFIPTAFFLAKAPLAHPLLKFIAVYGSFYIGEALMSVMYINRLHGNAWKQQVPVQL